MGQKHIRHIPDHEVGEAEFIFEPDKSPDGTLTIPLASILALEDEDDAVPRNMLRHVLERQGYELNEGRSLFTKKG